MLGNNQKKQVNSDKTITKTMIEDPKGGDDVDSNENEPKTTNGDKSQCQL